MDAQSRLLKSVAVVVLALGLTVSATASAKHQSQAIGNFDVEDRQDIEEIVREYILNHPEVLLESVQRLQAQERLAQEQQRRDRVERDVGHQVARREQFVNRELDAK